jgi:hypothetical protein
MERPRAKPFAVDGRDAEPLEAAYETWLTNTPIWRRRHDAQDLVGRRPRGEVSDDRQGREETTGVDIELVVARHVEYARTGGLPCDIEA